MNRKNHTIKTAVIQRLNKPGSQTKNRVPHLLLMISLALSLTVTAQTEYQIATNGTDLKQEYENELNTWLLQAYEGDSEAQFRVGVLYANEQFDKPDLEQSVYWYKQAARQGHALAQYNLGHHFLTGKGVEKNESNAVQWWLEAANSDHPLSQFNIGRAYYVGIGVEQDLDKSRYWFERAAENEEPKSIEILQELGWSDEGTSGKTKLMSKSVAVATADQAKVKANASKQQTNNKQAAAPQSATKPLTSRVTPIKANNSPNAQTKTATAKTKATPKNTQTAQAKATQAKATQAKAAQAKAAQAKTAQAKTAQAKKVTQKQASDLATKPVALYTNPEIKSVLIGIIDNRETLEIINTNKDWVTVKSPTGFPVWMHRDYLQISAGMATVSGNNVNARSVPIISRGTIVGTLDKGVRVKVLNSQNAWYRVQSPPDFIAWVKTDDYNRPPVVNNAKN